MSESMVERVARALCKLDGVDPDGPTTRGSVNWKLCEEDARAAIEAMREPTQGMINILSEAYFNIESVELDSQASATKNAKKLVTHIARGWQAMIDEALK